MPAWLRGLPSHRFPDRPCRLRGVQRAPRFADWVDSLPECADPAQGVSDAIVPAAARERVLAACGIADGQAGGAKTLEEAGRSGGTDFVINGMEE